MDGRYRIEKEKRIYSSKRERVVVKIIEEKTELFSLGGLQNESSGS